jgi:hypothetical protein
VVGGLVITWTNLTWHHRSTWGFMGKGTWHDLE